MRKSAVWVSKSFLMVPAWYINKSSVLSSKQVIAEHRDTCLSFLIWILFCEEASIRLELSLMILIYNHYHYLSTLDDVTTSSAQQQHRNVDLLVAASTCFLTFSCCGKTLSFISGCAVTTYARIHCKSNFHLLLPPFLVPVLLHRKVSVSLSAKWLCSPASC